MRNRVTRDRWNRTGGTGVYEPNRQNRPISTVISMISIVISIIGIISIISTASCISESILFSSSLGTVSFIRICNCNCNMNDRVGWTTPDRVYHGGAMILIGLFMPLSFMLRVQLQIRMKLTVLRLLLKRIFLLIQITVLIMLIMPIMLITMLIMLITVLIGRFCQFGF